MLQMPKRSLCDLVLDTIDIISARKNRPNLVRIYRHLHRLYDLSLSTCESLLQSLLKEGRVIRVTYKGNISYRNALKWKKYSYYMKKTMGSELPGTILTKAISELVVQEPDYLNMGVPCKILEEHLLSMKDYNISKETIHNLLQRELKHESLLQLDNGNYFLGPKPPDTPLFEGEEVDLKFDKIKKVKTYKHEIRRLKAKAIENMNSSNFILQNNNIPESNKVLSDLEEMNHSDIVTDIGGLDHLTTTDGKSSNDCKQNNTIIDTYSYPINTKVNMESADYESCRRMISENGMVSNEIHCSTKNLLGELQCRPLEELVEAESSSSQVIDSETSELYDNDKSPVEKPCTNLASEVRLSLESSDDSFSLSVSDNETTNSNLERNLPCDVTDPSKDTKSEKSKYKPLSSPDECEMNNKEISYSQHKSSSCKVDSDSNGQKNGHTSVYKIKNKDKSVPPVVERVQRKKRTKYDASEYYFPSLKRKTRESTSDNDKKEDKRRKKRKKDGVGCLSGIFAKRVMFPGNTSMCCECNCYISKVKLDPMIFCTTCANQGHQSCALKTMRGKDWYCVGCRTDASLPTCSVCNKMAHQEDRGILHSCIRCGDSYHKDCHSVTIKLPLSNEWQCFKCSIVENSPKGTEELSENVEKTDSPSSPELIHENNTTNNLQFLKEEPPDSRNWSSEEVYNYFKEYLDEEAANAFMEQDIDGYALKLMGRSDVLNLGLKLGPSLKVLFHVRRLQLRSNSLMEIWNN